VKLVAQIKELAKFSLAGWAAILTDYGIYNALLHLLGFPHWAAKTSSFICGGVVAFLINKYWTFRSQRGPLVEAGKFFIVNTAGLGVNVGVNQLVLDLSGGNTTLGFVAATLVAGLGIYAGQKFWVFRKRADREEQEEAGRDRAE
jgi:putative flippase GtrA